MTRTSKTMTACLAVFLLIGVNIVLGQACQDGQVLINGQCTNNDLTVPTGATTTAQNSSKMIVIQIGQDSNDANSLDFLVNTNFVGDFFITFSPTFVNADAVYFQISTVTQGETTVTTVSAIDSYFTKPFPEKPVADTTLVGGQNNIILLGYQVTSTAQSSGMIIKFKRLYDTGDQYDTAFKSNQMFLQRVLFGAPKGTNVAFANLYTGSFYFLLGAVTYPCAAGDIFNGTECVVNDVSAPALQNVAQFKSNDFLTINYETTQDGYINMLITAEISGYFGVGWGGNIMTLVDMIIVNVNVDNKNAPVIIVDDSYSYKKGAPVYDTLYGGTYDITVLGYALTTASTTVKIQRLMDDKDEFDFQFQADQEVPFDFAFEPNSNTVAYHDYNTGWGTLILQSANTQPCSAIGKIYINSACVVNDISTDGLDQTFAINNTNGQVFLNIQFGLSKDQEDLIMLLTIQNYGWFALGFQAPTTKKILAPTSMNKTDIVIFDIVKLDNGEDAVYIQDAWAVQNQAPQMDISLGGQTDYTLLGYQLNKKAGTVVAKIQRKLDTKDVYDYLFKVNSRVPIEYAFTSQVNNIQYHYNYYGVSVLPFFYTPPVCVAPQVNIDGQCEDNDLSALPSSVKDSFLNFQFDLSVKDTITILLEIQNVGWFGLGFGDSMTNTNMIIITNESGVVEIADYFSTTESSPDVSSNEGQNALTLLGYSITKTSTSVKFSRPLNTGAENDAILVPDQPITIIYAWGSSSSMTYHGNNYNGATFPLQQGYNGDLDGLDFDDTAKKIHFWANFVMWGFLVDIGFIIARFFKTGKFYKELHGLFMGSIVIFSAFSEFQMIDLHDILFNDNFSGTSDLVKSHIIIGFIFLIVLILEGFGGAFLNYLLSFKSTGGDLSVKVKSAHKYIGYFLYVLGKTNVFIGVRSIENDSQQTACIIGYVLFIVLRISLEYLYRKQPQIFSKILLLGNSQKHLEGDEDGRANTTSTQSLISTKECYSALVDMINSKKTTAEILSNSPKAKYVLYEDGIFDITQISHPGGKFIFEAVNGRDVCRFLIGSYPLESTKMDSHLHSSYALQLLLQNQIGQIQQPNILNSISFNQIWRARKESDLSISTGLFYFEPSQGGLQVQPIPKGMNWFGKHFSLRNPLQKNHKRLYTNCMSFSPSNKAAYSRFKSNFEALMNSANASVDTASFAGKQNVLPLVIKRYETERGFSKFLHDSLPDSSSSTEVLLEGPFGRGLELSEKSEGLHLIVAGGTGIIAFFDLLLFFSKYLMYKAVEKKHGNQVAKTLDVNQENFSQHIHPGFKLKVIAAFNSPEDDCGALSILESMKRLDNENNLNLFDAVVSVKKLNSNILTVDNQRFSLSYFEKHAGNLLVSRAFVCGPPGINRDSPIALEQLGLSASQILLV